jgi:AAA ATPase domain
VFVPSRDPGSALIGRHRECEALEQLVAGVRAGRSSVLVLRGESGVGKTALLEHALGVASDCRVVRAAGIESEREIAFAGLHQLCAPMLERLEDLPAPQRDALRTAFGLRDGAAPDRFLVGLAVLTLLSEVAAERPLVCIVDDAQWLDRASAQALAFAARRLLADPVALVVALREPSDDSELIGLPELSVEGISNGDARLLLASAVPGRLDDRVRDQIVAEATGNPLALLELCRGLTPAELAGGLRLPDIRPVTSRIEQRFVRRLRSLSREAGRLLLIAAAEPIGDASLLWRAADRLEIKAGTADLLDTGLLELDAGVRFRHPLMRSAVYRTASAEDRRAVHRALADVTDPDIDPDRRAWHLAHSTVGLDEAVAGELEGSADRAQRRGGVAAATAFLQPSTELTPDPAWRGARALAAARDTFEAGAPDRASELLATAKLGPLDELQRARLERLRAQIEPTRTRGNDAPLLLLMAAQRLEPLDAALARETYLEALAAAIFAGRLAGGSDVLEVAEAARLAPPPREPLRPIDLLLDGLATRFTEGYAASVVPIRRALHAFRLEDGSRQDDSRWLWLACRTAPEVWDDEAWHELATRQVRLARDAGALPVFSVAVTFLASQLMHAGELGAASALLDEADVIAEIAGKPPLIYASLVLAAWRGHEAQAVALIEAGVEAANAQGEGRAITLAGLATAILNNGLGRYESALTAAQRACEHDDLGLYGWALIELVEAAVRCGRREVAAVAGRRLDEHTRASGTDWALGIEARSRALLTDGQAAEALYREAIELLARSRGTAHLARAHLVYGEWLRRENRRLDARKELRRAHDTFIRIGADAFAERARRELLATRETVRKPTDEPTRS